MKSKRFELSLITTVLVSALVINFAFVGFASATTIEVSSEENPYRIYELKAKVAYLTEFLEALREGDGSPAPTFVVALKGSYTMVFGTVARDSQSGMAEDCGTMSTGTIDWGDGDKTTLLGLGCSGNAHPFSVKHQYEESGSYHVVVTDAAGRTKTHVLAIKVNE